MSRWKYFILVTGILLSHRCFAQQPATDLEDTTARSFSIGGGWSNLDFETGDLLLFQHFNYSVKNELGIKIQSVLSSNSLTLPFSSAALQNQFIDDDTKNGVAEKVKAMNAFKFNSFVQLNYRFERDSFLFREPALYSISFKTGSIQEVKFTDDLFNVIFYGNAGFAGQTADFSGSKDLSYNFSQLRFAAQKKFGKDNNRWEGGLGISVVTAKYGSSVHLDNATLFTEQNGEYIDAAYNFTYFVADSSNSGRFQVDGVGASLDLSVSFSPSNNDSRFIFNANDIGFIGWNKRSRIYSADSSLHFEGIEVNDLLHSDDSSLLHFNADTLLHKTGTKVKVSGYTTALPLKFSFAYVRALNEKWMGTAGISYSPFPDLFPMIFIQPQYTFTPSVRAALLLAYGGTDGFRVGLQVNGIVAHRLFLQAGSENILGIFVPKETTSTSLFLQASLRF